MFVGREEELEVLRRLFESDKFEFVGIYGRRRVGKTALVSEFVRDLPCIYNTAVEDGAGANLRNLSQAIFLMENPDSDPDGAPVFHDFAAAVEAVFRLAQGRRLVFVIDEFPYLAKACTAFPSILQSAIDRNKDGSKLLLILCGSSLSFMKEQLFDKGSPLYGRRTAQIELKPFDFFDSCALFPGADMKTVAELYGMVGGIPLYLRSLEAGLGLEGNISKAFLDPSSFLYDEPANLLKQEVSKAALYNSVISTIASGSLQHNEIATGAGIESSALDYYLKELVRIGLVEKEVPVVAGGRGIWCITDNLFRFWYRFIRPRQPLVERGLGQKIAGRIVKSYPAHMGAVFESICRDWVWRAYADGELGIDLTDVGKWWGNDLVAREQTDIDVVAVDDGKAVLVGECKWRNEPVGASVLSTLDRRAGLVGTSVAAPRLLFSKGGYTDGSRELAREMSNARLIDVDDFERYARR